MEISFNSRAGRQSTDLSSSGSLAWAFVKAGGAGQLDPPAPRLRQSTSLADERVRKTRWRSATGPGRTVVEGGRLPLVATATLQSTKGLEDYLK
jgi:hypothetical protein